MFTVPGGAAIDKGNLARRDFKPLLKRAGLPDIRFHDLRHSTASILLEMGVNPKIIQELLGHSQISVTMDIYSHAIPGLQKEAVKKMKQALSGGEEREAARRSRVAPWRRPRNHASRRLT